MNSRHRFRWATVAVAALAVALAVAVAARRDRDAAGTPVGAAAELETLDGGTTTLADYRGKPLVLNFFASWCPPCLAEMPGFERVHQDLAGRVGFLGVNLQDRVTDGRAVVEQTGVTYDIARDPDGDLFAAFGGIAMPTTVFIDADGNIVDVQSGELSAGGLADRIDDELLG